MIAHNNHIMKVARVAKPHASLTKVNSVKHQDRNPVIISVSDLVQKYWSSARRMLIPDQPNSFIIGLHAADGKITYHLLSETVVLSFVVAPT